MSYTVLSDEQAEQFLNQGFVKIDGCFDKADIQDWIDLAFNRLGYQPDTPTAWTEARVDMPSMNSKEVA